MNKREILDILKQYKEANRKKYGLQTLGVFGSYARSEETAMSDVDIVLQTETPNMFNVIHIKNDLEKQLNLPVDIVRLRKNMNPLLRQRIDQEAFYV